MDILIYIIGGLIGLLVILSLIAPKETLVHREILVEKPIDEVFEYVLYFKNQDQWSPWAAKDPNMDKEIIGTDGEVGCISRWSGNKEVGVGEQELTYVDKNKIIRSELRFEKPFKSVSQAYLEFEEVSGGTEVVWGFHAENKFPGKIFMLFMDMDKQLGGDFEKGLQQLKKVLEG